MDVRFKRHILHHWVTSKKDEDFKDSIRRVYVGRSIINLEIPEEVEGMGEDTRPYELPSQFVGYFICKIRCPICNRDFQTAIPAADFVTSGSPRTGAFIHYVDDNGCGSSFTVVETRHMRIRVLVAPREGGPLDTWVDSAT